MGNTASECLCQVFSGDRLVEETEDSAFIDGAHGGFRVGTSGEHDADRVGSNVAHSGEELGAIHDGHAHVGNHHDVGAIIPDLLQPRFRPFGQVSFELAVDRSG